MADYYVREDGVKVFNAAYAAGYTDGAYSQLADIVGLRAIRAAEADSAELGKILAEYKASSVKGRKKARVAPRG